VLTLLKYPSVSERRQQRPKGGDRPAFMPAQQASLPAHV